MATPNRFNVLGDKSEWNMAQLNSMRVHEICYFNDTYIKTDNFVAWFKGQEALFVETSSLMSEDEIKEYKKMRDGINKTLFDYQQEKRRSSNRNMNDKLQNLAAQVREKLIDGEIYLRRKLQAKGLGYPTAQDPRWAILKRG